MIDGKRFKFGHGDISVGGNPVTRQMDFQQFRLPAKVGDKVMDDEVELIGERIFLEIGYEDYQELSKLLGSVKSRKISEFTFKNYVFDFTNYNEKSVDVCRQKLSEAMKFYFFAMAC